MCAHAVRQYWLRRARVAASVGVPYARAPVKSTIDQLTRVMQKVHAQKFIQLSVSDMPKELYFSGEVQDFQEIIGNLLDNAYKWTNQRISINGDYCAGKLRLNIEDDGPGCENLTQSAHLPRRGQRADESVPGSGLGLSIAHDLIELYDGEILFTDGAPNGLRITLKLPGGLS